MFEKFIKLALAVVFAFIVIVLGLVIAHYAQDLVWIALFGAIAIIAYRVLENDTTKRR